MLRIRLSMSCVMPDYTGSVGYSDQFARDIGSDLLKTPPFTFIDKNRQVVTGKGCGGNHVNWRQGTIAHCKRLEGHAGMMNLEGWHSSSHTF
jgi:hypothetical protein